MPARFQAPRGTFDVLPSDQPPRARLLALARDLLGRAGYGRIDTPIFEDTELFARSVGESTDVVRKEMFTFSDRGGPRAAPPPGGPGPPLRAPRPRRGA